MAYRHFYRSFALFTLFFTLDSGLRLASAQTASPVEIATASSGIQDPIPAESKPPQPGQLRTPVPPGSPGPVGQTEEKRIMGVLPNYRTAEMGASSAPLTSKQKMTIAVKDTFDYPLVFIAAAYSGLYQADDSHPEFGQGAKGYFSRLGTSYTDQIDGNMLTEGILPVLLHEDPRYFRLAHGSIKERTWYALSRIVVTKTDSGRSSFNAAEVFGNGIAAAVGLSYYPDDRDVASYLQNWTTQLGTDAASQLLKEFWPDIKHKWAAHRERVREAKNGS